MKSRERRFQSAVADHKSAVEAFLAAAAAVPPELWGRPAGEGKWSPRQVTEHVSLSLEAIRRNLEGGPAMRYRVSSWKRWILRRVVLPGLLRTGRFPPGTRAPRETRPSDSESAPAESLERLETAAAALDSCWAGVPSASSRKLGHPYFGAIAADELVRLMTWHALHHRAQLPGV